MRSESGKFSIDRSERRRFLMLTLGTAFALLAIDLIAPFCPDNSIYQAMGFQLVRFGRLPSIGTWDTNFPGIMLIHALAIVLFGNSETGFRIVDLAVHIGIAGLLYQLCSRFYEARTAYVVAVLSCFYYLFSLHLLAGQRDGFAAILILGSVLACYRFFDSRSARGSARSRGLWTLWPIILSGALTTGAVVIRPTYGLVAVVVLSALILIEPRAAVRTMLAVALGSAIVLIPVVLPYLLIPDGLHQVYVSTIRFNLDVYGSGLYRMPFAEAILKRQELGLNLLLAMTIVFVIWGSRRPRLLRVGSLGLIGRATSHDLYFLGAILLSAKLSIWSMGKFYLYHYEVLLAFSVLLFAPWIEFAFSGEWIKNNRLIRTTGVAIVLVLATLICYPWHLAGEFLSAVLAGKPNPVQYARNHLEHFPDFGEWAEDDFTGVLKQRLQPLDRVEVVSMDPGLSWRSGAEMASRFTTVLGIGLLPPSGKFTSYQLAWRREFVDSIKLIKPRFLVLGDGPDSLTIFLAKSPAETARSVPGFDSLLQTCYHLDTSLHRWSLYERN